MQGTFNPCGSGGVVHVWAGLWLVASSWRLMVGSEWIADCLLYCLQYAARGSHVVGLPAWKWGWKPPSRCQFRGPNEIPPTHSAGRSAEHFEDRLPVTEQQHGPIQHHTTPTTIITTINDQIDARAIMTDLFHGFASLHVRVPPPQDDPELDLEIFCRHYKPSSSDARPLLLIHGHPQTHVIWHRLAALLVQTGKWELVIVDTRGMGQSSAPPPREDRPAGYRYAKRELARDLVEVMRHFGHERFHVVGHDRGGRITHRMALDHPKAVEKCILLDIAPTVSVDLMLSDFAPFADALSYQVDMYKKADSTFASLYWHWFFLIQPAPFPETLLLANPSAYLEKMTARFPNAKNAELIHDKAAYESYLSNMSSPGSVAAMCEDYRASAPGGPDYVLDEEDRKQGKKVECAVSSLYGSRGIIHLLYKGGLDLWQECCQQPVRGAALDAGHYLPEERPQDIAAEIDTFFG